MTRKTTPKRHPDKLKSLKKQETPQHLNQRRYLKKLSPKKRVRGRHSRKRISWWHHVQEWMWPTMGLSAFFRLQELKLHRSTGTAHSVSLGLAVGIGTAFLPSVGQSVFSIAIAWPFGGNPVAAVVGSLAGNPWTYAMFWSWDYWLGNLILGRTPEVNHIGIELVEKILADPLSMWDVFFWPCLVGAIPSGIVAAFISYFIIYRNILFLQKARKAWIMHQRQQEHVVRYRSILSKLKREKEEEK